jgi:steroid delta-isomerase-like uncharacterized protein
MYSVGAFAQSIGECKQQGHSVAGYSARHANQLKETDMSQHHNIAAHCALVRDFIEQVWNRRDTAQLSTYLSEDYIDHAYQPANSEGLHNMLMQLGLAFPDAQQEIAAITAQDDMVVCRITMTATHQGPFRDAPASGNAVRVQVYRSYRIVDGKIAEHWALLDTATLLRQIGANVSNQNACVRAA